MSRTPMTDDTRFEMAMNAASRERRNRPVALLVLAAAALLLAGIIAVAGMVSRGSAAREYQDQLDAAARTEVLLAQLAQLRAAEQSGTIGAAHDPIPLIITKIGDAAVRAGLNQPTPPREASAPRAGVTVKDYMYTGVRADSLEPLLEWIRLACVEIPGLELYQIQSLKPEPNGWVLSVHFRRWERTG